MEVAEIEKRIIPHIDNEMGDCPWKFDEDMNDVMLLDSMDKASLFVEVETEFDITILHSEMEDITTPWKLVKLVEEKFK